MIAKYFCQNFKMLKRKIPHSKYGPRISFKTLKFLQLIIFIVSTAIFNKEIAAQTQTKPAISESAYGTMTFAFPALSSESLKLNNGVIGVNKRQLIYCLQYA